MQKIDLKLIEDFSYRGKDINSGSTRKRDNEMQMSPALIHILQEVQRELGYETAEQSEDDATRETDLPALVGKIAGRLGFDLTNFERDQVLEYLEREQKPFGLLQALVDDQEISDIIVTDYSKVSVQRGRQNYSTSLSFPSHENYVNFVERLLQKAGATFSTKKPIADGMIGSFARIHAVHKSLCESGPYLTLRLNRFSSVSSKDLVRFGLAPQGIFDYLNAMVTAGATLLIVGEVGTGKTTLARALASGMPAEESILVIEDTPEIKLEHPHVRYLTTREANTDGAGKVSPSECIRGGMRMAMNRIIFGEMRDAEAAEAFIDVCASGHPGLSTIHAKSAAESLTRLELFLGRAQKGVTRGVLNEQIATAVQAIVFVDICRETGKRRIQEVKEIGPVADGVIRQRDMFKYQVRRGLPEWRVLNKVSAHREAIERTGQGVNLSSYPAVLDLEMNQLYQEAAYRHST